jgi:hypothetical protein
MPCLKPSVFDGDGRHMIAPDIGVASFCLEHGMTPLPVRRWTANFIIREFMRTGRSLHTARGSTVWIIKQHCDVQGIPYEILKYYLDGDVHGGYVIVNPAHGKGELA